MLATKEELKTLATKKDLDELAGDVVRIENKVDEIDSRLSGVETKLIGVETRLDSVEVKLGSIESKLDNIVLSVKTVPRMKEIIQDKLGVEV